MNLVQNLRNTYELGFNMSTDFQLRIQEKKSSHSRLLAENEFDIFSTTELNRHWKNIPPDQRLSQRASRWFSSAHTAVAYNNCETPKSD
mmetsp:Transcript_11149/g.17055  ORF Transcript_11149/g.17055 Transcript_11149/m.17055 type:complete len:89 (+) Transcript_11149:482-748(+)